MVRRARNVGVKLGLRDLEILVGHVACHRITTRKVLHRIKWPDAKMAAVESWLARMTDGGYLAAEDLARSGHEKYFRLTSKLLGQLEESKLFAPLAPKLAKPVPDGALLDVYGRLAFCCLGEQRFAKYASHDFVSRYPHLLIRGLPTDCYYRDPDYHDERWEAKKRIGLIFVAARNTPRIVERCSQLIGQRLRTKPWEEVLKKDRFIIGIATTAEAKRRQVVEALDEHVRRVPFRIEVRETLADVFQESRQHAAHR